MEKAYPLYSLILRIMLTTLPAMMISSNGALSQPVPSLQLLEIAQVRIDARFDLSGLVKKGDKYYAVADKAWNNYIYEIKQQHSENGTLTWVVSDSLKFNSDQKIDIEGIDYCNNTFYLINEEDNSVFTIDENMMQSPRVIKFEKQNITPVSWKKNTGLEGIAIDCNSECLYIAKEREPRSIYEIHLKTGKISQIFNVDNSVDDDYSDLKIENGFLYVLERSKNQIAKIDLSTKEKVAVVSYGSTVMTEEGRLYEPTKYGMAEAILLEKNEIWIGIDNNGLSTSPIANKKFNLTGKHPSILKFKRPEGF